MNAPSGVHAACVAPEGASAFIGTFLPNDRKNPRASVISSAYLCGRDKPKKHLPYETLFALTPYRMPGRTPLLLHAAHVPGSV